MWVKISTFTKPSSGMLSTNNGTLWTRELRDNTINEYCYNRHSDVTSWVVYINRPNPLKTRNARPREVIALRHVFVCGTDDFKSLVSQKLQSTD